jgi:hypothetical protein
MDNFFTVEYLYATTMAHFMFNLCYKISIKAKVYRLITLLID